MLKKLALILAIAAVVGTAAFITLRMNSMALMRSYIERKVPSTLQQQTVTDRRFEIVFCGTGSPLYQPDRAQPCLGVVAGGRFFLFDAGQGASRQLHAVGAPILSLDAVYLTHLHSDHISGVGDVLHNGWLYGRRNQVNLVGPPGTTKFLNGVRQSFEDDMHERQRIVGIKPDGSHLDMAKARDLKIEGDGAIPVYSENGVLISAFRVDHPAWDFAYGYKIEYGGKTVVVSGDTRYTPAIVTHARDADLLIHEAVNLEMMRTITKAVAKHGGNVDPKRIERIRTTHTPTNEVATAAAKAGVERLVLTHLIPPIPALGFIEGAFIKGMDKIYDGEIVVARDGMRIKLLE
ncbi:MAG: MBL fold metallo-hydrolase [bacterium]|nr:MBL fold metallo-hydrolase [bacterium]